MREGHQPGGTLLDLLHLRAEEGPATTAYTFLRDGAEPGVPLAYGDLAQQTRAASSAFRDGAKPGDRVLLLYPPGLDFLSGFLGAISAGLIAVPAYLPRPQAVDDRIRAIASDSQPRIAATTREHVDRLRAQFASDPELSHITCVASDDEGLPGVSDRAPGPTRATDVAHLQYTSGSTAVPKGVKVTHANLLHNLADMDEGWRHDEGSTIVSWLPAFHDMGLVYGLLAPLYTGVPGVVMPPVAFIQRPVRWLQALTRYRGTHSAAPNFAYDLCVRKVRPEDRAALDLSSWRVAVNGAEPVRAETLERFARTFGPSGFRRSAFAPGYGLAEATLKVTATRVDEGPLVSSFSTAALERGVVAPPSSPEDARELVACGSTADGRHVAIVDPERGAPAAPDAIGEIWVSGPSVAGGYWNREEESPATFSAHLPGERETFLRTGDLGFVAGGRLYVAGRLKDLIIVRGQNYYPQDLEHTSEGTHEAFHGGASAAFGIDREGEERVVIVQEVDRHFRAADRQGAVEAIRRAVADAHELHVFDVVLVRPGAVPKTSSGKVQRRACREAYLNGTLRGRIEDAHELA